MNDWDEIIQLAAGYCGDISQKRVLDIGCDTEGYAIEAMATRFHALEAVGVNLKTSNRILPKGCQLVRADVRNLPFHDNYFDFIFSTSAFEHITDLDLALNEMHRVLKPGGQLFTHFGPIWSTSYGHHLWFDFQGKTYTYWNVHLPAFCHLLQTPQEIYEMLLADYPSEVSEAIVNYVFDSGEQNKLFFDDYEQLFRDSKFQITFFKGYDYPELSRVYTKSITPSTIRQLKSRYPRNSGFLYDGIVAVLRKVN